MDHQAAADKYRLFITRERMEDIISDGVVKRVALSPLSKSSFEVGPDRGASSELQRVHVCVFNF